MMNDPVFKVYVICSAILSLNMLVLGAMTGARRGKYKSLLNPEDAGFQKRDGEHPEVQRAMNAHRNAIENILPFFGIGAIFAASGQNPLVAQILLGVFTGARILHTVVYLAGKQPWRTMMFAIGALTTAAMAVMSVLKVF